jgi:hypothetical protein
LVKKCIELSVLCDQEIFLFVADEEKQKVLHYGSSSELDFLQLFNSKYDREFVTNKDYQKVGGDKQSWDNIEKQDAGVYKRFLKGNWTHRNCTSQVGSIDT